MKKVLAIFLVICCLLMPGFASAGSEVVRAGSYYYYADESFIYRVDEDGGGRKAILSVGNYFSLNLRYYDGKIYYITDPRSIQSYDFYLCYVDPARGKEVLFKKNVEDYIFVGDVLFYTQRREDRMTLYAQHMKTGEKRTIHNKPDVYIGELMSSKGCLMYSANRTMRIYDYSANKNRSLADGLAYFLEYGNFLYAGKGNEFYQYTLDSSAYALKNAKKLTNLIEGSPFAVVDGYVYIDSYEDHPYNNEIFYNVLYRQKLGSSSATKLYTYTGAPSDYQHFFHCGDYIWVYAGGGDVSSNFVRRIKI